MLGTMWMMAWSSEVSRTMPLRPVAAELHDAAYRVQRRHMAVLGTWAAVNMVGGSIGWLTSDEPQAKAFHGTNAAWNTVNAGLALSGLFSKRWQGQSLAEVDRKNRSLRRALLANIAADGVYMGTGAVLWSTGGRSSGIDLRGAGQALVLQGGFLLVFDAIFVASHQRLDGKFSIRPSGTGVSGTF